MNPISLNELKPGRTGRIISVGGFGTTRRRLLEMGIRSGATVKMIKSAPLLDPLEISLGNGHISIRRAEAALIMIDILSAD
jgi:Fe2+ transport system protein FeoA